MAAKVQVQARIDEEVKAKAKAAAVLASIGLTVSDAVRLMLIRVARDKALPFEPLVPNAATIAAMAEARAGSGSGTRVDTVDALIAELNGDT